MSRAIRVAPQAELRTLHIGRRGRRARHLILFRVVPDGAVEVLRFLHDAMDLPRYLPAD
jgi:toxin ParE1/3/4